MKIAKTIVSTMLISTTIIFGRVHIILFDCSGSFIEGNFPALLKTSSLNKINDIVKLDTDKNHLT